MVNSALQNAEENGVELALPRAIVRALDRRSVVLVGMMGVAIAFAAGALVLAIGGLTITAVQEGRGFADETLLGPLALRVLFFKNKKCYARLKSLDLTDYSTRL